MELILCTQEDLDSSYLMHYRVGGEKKGVRRWQNEDKSLTPAGREHYAEMYGHGDGRSVSKADENGRREDDKASEDTKKSFQKEMKKLGRYDLQSNARAQKKEMDKRNLLTKKALETTVSRAASSAIITAIAGGDFIKALGTPIAFGGMAAYHKVLAQVAKYRTSDIGHDKAVARYNRQFEKMVDTYRDTPFADVLEGRYKIKTA